MSEKDKPKTESPDKEHPPKKEGDYFEKGQQGVIPPKPHYPQRPDEGSMNEGAPGWTPPKSDE